MVKELYGVDVSPTLVSQITADLDAKVTAWRQRRLEAVWPIVYFDGIVVHVRGDNSRVSPHTIYVAIGVNLQGKKELLGLWLTLSRPGAMDRRSYIGLRQCSLPMFRLLGRTYYRPPRPPLRLPFRRHLPDKAGAPAQNRTGRDQL